MELITIESKKSRIDSLNRDALKHCTRVDAAIAYISEENTLINGCIKADIPLKLYGRYDYSVPVHPRVLTILADKKHPNLELRLVPDIFHPKVIWWRKYGAYIGSANLTNTAWFRNIEAGIFLSEEELYAEDGIAEQLEDFFIQTDDRSHALTREIVEHLRELFDSNNQLRQAKKAAEDSFEKGRVIPKTQEFHEKQRQGLARFRDKFIREWDETLEIMRMIGDRVASNEYRPKWVNSNVPTGVQADQFLHAYYYNHVTDEANLRRHPYLEFFQINKSRKEEALEEELVWWKGLTEALSKEDLHMHEYAPLVRNNLAQSRILNLTTDDFFETCCKIHALAEHARQINWLKHNIVVPPQMKRIDRVRILSDWLFKQRNALGQGPLELISYVLYGGSDGEIAQRIFEASFEKERKIPHLSVSTFGEIVGWALPEKFPPRNGRTSKALTALGYDVEVYSA